MRNAIDQSVYTKAFGITVPADRCEAAGYYQIPLYSAPNVPYPTGAYRLSLRVTTSGAEIGNASMPLTIE